MCHLRGDGMIGGARGGRYGRMPRLRTLAGCLLATLLASCGGGTGLLRPAPLPALPVIPVPDHYSAGPAGADGAPLSSDSAGAWWHTFGSAELDALIDRGLANNPDMRVAVQHIIQAKARLEQARAGRLPALSAPLLLADQSAGGSAVGAAPAGGVQAATGSQRTLQAGVRADWRLDLWGEQGALAESARFQLLRAIYERDNVERNLCAAIAGSYIDYLGLNDRRRIAQQTDAVQSATLTSIESRVKAGDATVADLEQQRAAIFSVRATLPVLEQNRVDAITTLAFLVGTVPGRLTLSDAGLDSLRTPPTLTGLPSQLLLRRPDVRMAEAMLHGARADIGVARARLLPPMDLAAQIGRSAANPAQLLLPQTLFWSLVDSVSVSLFDGGRRQNDETIARAVAEEMVEGYVRAIHLAIKEVESALQTVQLSDQRLAAEQATLESARRASEIAVQIYKVGGADYLTLLDTERSYHHYLDNFAIARAGHFHAHVTLLAALGSGSSSAEPAAQDSAGSGREGGTTQPTAARPSAGKVAAAVAGVISQACLAGIPGDEGHPDREGDWQVELVGTYHCATVGPAWRDLRQRYPNSMSERVLRPTLLGRVEEAGAFEQSWFRLAVSRFGSHAQAEAFCAALQADQMRCAVAATPLARVVGAGAHPAPPAAAAAPAGGLDVSRLDEDDAAGFPGGAPPADPSVRGTLGQSLVAAGAAGLPQDAPAGRDADGARTATSGERRTTAGREVATARYLQLGAFRDEARAEALRHRADEALHDLGPGTLLRREGALTLVWVGPFASVQNERQAGSRLREVLGSEPRSVRGPLAKVAEGL